MTSKSAEKTLTLQIRQAGSDAWGTLEIAKYDDGAASMTRKKVEAALRARMAGWSSNYAPFRDATFRVVDSEAEQPAATLGHEFAGNYQRLTGTEAQAPGYVSPPVAAAATSTRTEADVRAARNAKAEG